MTVLEQLHALQTENPLIQMHALVDGLVFRQVHGEPLTVRPGCVALFDETPDVALATAGPWLLDARDHAPVCDALHSYEATHPLVSWLMTDVPFAGLVQLLRLKLDVRLPDGTMALLRFYDPRVLYSLAETLTDRQREEFFGHIDRWCFMHKGEWMTIGRHHA